MPRLDATVAHAQKAITTWICGLRIRHPGFRERTLAGTLASGCAFDTQSHVVKRHAGDQALQQPGRHRFAAFPMALPRESTSKVLELATRRTRSHRVPRTGHSAGITAHHFWLRYAR